MLTPSEEDLRFFRSRLLRWFKSHGRDFTWRRTRDPWLVLMAEMMLRRTRAAQVEKVYNEFVREYREPRLLAAADMRCLRRQLLPLGLAWRIPQFKSLATTITKRFGGAVPSTRTELLSLPGVGDYVAGAVLSIAQGKREWIVDTNIVRVFRRYFGVKPLGEGRRDKTIVGLAKVYVNTSRARQANLAILDFAALVCVWPDPKCSECGLKPRCHFFEFIVRKSKRDR